jgi:hypothetical protein
MSGCIFACNWGMIAARLGYVTGGRRVEISDMSTE